jgi:hypothetical protein
MNNNKTNKETGRKAKPGTHWYIVDMDANTNEWVAKQLAKTQDVFECESLIDAKGKEHKGYGVVWAIVELLRNSQGQFGFRFKIYRRQGRHGKLSEATFLNKTRKKFKIRKGDETVKI